MKNSKLVLGLTLCLGLLFSMSAIEQNVSAEIGWAIAQEVDASDGVEVALTAAGSAAGALAGAEVGASIGSLGGPIGTVVGAGLGAL
ncbi:hypothetical protein [Pontimicrobium sp. MEBiC06410]